MSAGEFIFFIGADLEQELSYAAALSVQDTVDKTYDAALSVQGEVDKTYDAALHVQETIDKTYDAQMLVSLYETKRHLCPTDVGLRILVEIDWPGGSRRYAWEDLAVEETGYDGRLITIGDIVQGTNGRRDALSIELENLACKVTIESLWSDTNPPENSPVRAYYWFEGDFLDGRIKVFEGVVEQVDSITEERIKISCVSIEEKHDKPLGAEITTTNFSDAPDEALGRIEPLVFGIVERFEGIPVTTIAKSALRSTLLKAITTISLEDPSKFPTTGTVKILDEEITYTGKSGNNLTGATRGANSTVAKDYGPGQEVVEKGSLEILLSGHTLAAIDAVYASVGERIKKLDAADYTATLTPKGKVTFASGWPLISVPDGQIALQQVQFNDAGVGNTALSGGLACGDNASYSEKNGATLKNTGFSPAASILEVEQTDDVTPSGDIVRAWLGVEFDESPFPLGAGIQVDVKLTGGSVLGQLSVGGNLPGDLKDRAGLGTTRAYDDQHIHGITDAAETTVALKASTVVPITDTTNPANSYDDDLGTFGNFMINPGRTWSGFSISQTGRSLVKMRAKVKWADTFIGTYGWVLELKVDGAVKASVTMPKLNGTGERDTDWFVTNIWADFNNATVFIRNQISSSEHLDIYEARLEIVYTTNPTYSIQNASALLHTRTSLFDVTSSVTGWAWFKNLKARCEYVGAVGADVKINRVYFLIEYSPLRDQPADRILADIKGFNSTDRRPTDHLKTILTDASMLGLVGTSYDAGALLAAKVKHDAIPFRMDFAIVDSLMSSDLIGRICEQSRMMWWWEAGGLWVLYRDDPSAMAAILTHRKDDVIPDSLSRKRTMLREAVTKVVATYRYDWEKRNLSRNVTSTQTPATGLGTREVKRQYDLLRDAVSAQNLADYETLRWYRPRYVVEWSTYMPGLEVKRGTIMALVIDRFNYTKLEVDEVTFSTEKVRIHAIVFDTI